MDDATIQRLNEINRRFYEITADEFDQTRSTPWQGWARLLPHLAGGQGRARLLYSVLDVGCGNGRFGLFLAEHLNSPIHYHGIDSSSALLSYAKESLAAAPRLTFILEQRDLIESPPETDTYDLVAAFGLLHHIPGYIQRQTFIRILSQRVKPGGLLAFAAWRFYEHERFRERIVPWGDDLAAAVERHDYLLDWRRGETAVRYCHYMDDEEQAALVAASGLELAETYRADGFNQYSILKK